MAVLEIVAAADEPMRFTDILRRSDQPRGTLHRQLSNLIEEGLLAVSRDHSYSLGIRLLKFASKAWAGNDSARSRSRISGACTSRRARRCISACCAAST